MRTDLLAVAIFFFLAGGIQCQSSSKPNILLFMLDDVDSELGGDSPLAKTRGWIHDEGVTFLNAFVSTPVCCPSRASFLTGLYQHNHGVRNNSVAGDCSGDGWRGGRERETFAARLSEAGYATFYAGKYLNQYGTEEGGGMGHVPPGWDSFVGLKGNSVYYNYELSVDGEVEAHGEDPEVDYLTEVIGRKAQGFLDTYLEEEEEERPPFLMFLSTPAAHAPFEPAQKYEEEYPDALAPRWGICQIQIARLLFYSLYTF